MKKQPAKALAHPLAHVDADALRIKVTLVLLRVMIAACLFFLVSYVITGDLALIPYIVFPFLLPSIAFHYYLDKYRKYRYILWALVYLYSVLGLMKLTSSPGYLVDLFLLPTYIGGSFLVLRSRHAIPMMLYLLSVYVLAGVVVYWFQPFPILYTNDNVGSIVTGFIVSTTGSGIIFYVFSSSYQQNSERLSEILYTLGKVNDDNKLLINVVSHDFRNYLTRLVLLIEISKNRTQDPRHQEDLGNLEAAIHKLSDLINDIQVVRDLSRDEALDTTMPVLFDEILKKTDLIFRHVMVEKQLQFDKTQLQPLKIDVNPDIFTHIILSNLIGNAIKFAPPRSRIILGLEANAGVPVLSITNQASVEHLPNLMKIMQGKDVRTSVLGTSNEQGQGLGLSILRKFCRLYNIDFTLSVASAADATTCLVTSKLAFASCC